MPLHPHLVASIDEVLPQLAAHLASPTDDLFARELVVVPSAGVQQWLTERLATVLGARPGGADGIVASIDFAFPGALVSRALGGRESDDPWSVDRLTPTLLDLIAEQPERLPRGRGRDGLLSAARRTADLFDRYHFHRPGMMRRWAAGHAVLHEVAGEPEPPLPDSAHWQFALWRAAQARIGQPSPPERTAAAIARLNAGERPDALPSRVFIVGVTALPALHLDVLHALAPHSEVHLWMAHPSPGLLQATWPQLEDLPPQRLAVDKHPARQLARLPQLDSWTRPSQGMQVLLAGAGIRPALPAVPDAPPATGTPLLARVQQALRSDHMAAGLEGIPPDPSLQLHRAHGLARQCEVLRELLLHCFTELPDLDPREVLIVAPDIATVAPQLDGVFPPREPGAAPDALALPVRVADRTLMQANEVAGLLDQLLALPEGRVGIADLRALCAVPALRSALGVEEDIVDTWFGWAEQLRVRWGLTAGQRERFGLPADLSAHTWQQALQRLVAGAAMGGPTAYRADAADAVIPARGVEIGELPAVGALARLLRLLTDFVDATVTDRPITEWCDLLLALLDQLSAVPREGSAQRARVLRLLAGLRDDASASRTPVAFHELRTLLGPALAGDPGRAFLRSGQITATSLVPLRGVPYRVVCLVGLDDGALSAGDGDAEDLLRVQPLVGDPDPRGEQRQALLETILQARERLIITCTGADPRSNKEVEPITPLSELLDLVRAVGTDPKTITVDHPRHAADPRNFTPGGLLAGQPFGHYEAHRHAARFLAPRPEGGGTRPAVATGDLPGGALSPEIAANDLALLLDDPLSLYVKRTLGIDVFEDDGDEEPLLPTEATRRDYAAATADLLQAMLQDPTGHDVVRDHAPAWCRRIAARGVLPPLALGDGVLTQGEQLVWELQNQLNLKGLPSAPGSSEPVRVPLRDGRAVVGRLDGLHGQASVQLLHLTTERNTPRLSQRQRIATWLLALQRRDLGVRSIFLGQHEKTTDKTFCRAGTIAEGVTLDVLQDRLEALVALYDEALRQPRPVFGDTADKLLQSEEAGLEAFAQHCRKPLPPYRVESRVYGPTPDFHQVFGDPALRAFLARWAAFKTGPVLVATDTAKRGDFRIPPKSAAKPRKGKSA
jgi:exodeoxyribonuclease V gamma subunit